MLSHRKGIAQINGDKNADYGQWNLSVLIDKRKKKRDPKHNEEILQRQIWFYGFEIQYGYF